MNSSPMNKMPQVGSKPQGKQITYSKTLEEKLKPGEIRQFVAENGRVWSYKLDDIRNDTTEENHT